MTNKLAMRSCQACKARKRRCTREMPACRLCVRGRRSCLYQSKQDCENQQTETSESAAITPPSREALRNSFPVATFLDPTLFAYCAPLATPHRHIPVPLDVQHLLGDIGSQKAVAEDYFITAHRWTPIISRVRFYGMLANSSRENDPNLIALLLGMKLLLSRPEEVDLHCEMYTLTKDLHLRMEMAGYVSIYLVQSSILTALYEMGHAIYPGAFSTVSTAARHAIALGITGTSEVHGKSWIEQEERNRTWWAITILDRLVNLNLKGRHLCTPDPSVTSILPIDDDAWDQGILPAEHIRTVFSTPSMKDGRYARLAQAVNLLSRVYRHVSSPEEALRLDLESIAQLERTLFALERLSSIDEQENDVCCFFSIATCHIATLVLRTTYLSESPDQLTEKGKVESYRSIQTVTARILQMIEDFRVGVRGTIENIPPVALDWLYRPMVAHLVLAQNTPIPSSKWEKPIPQLKEALEGIDRRWKAATYYLRLLETRQAVKIPW